LLRYLKTTEEQVFELRYLHTADAAQVEVYVDAGGKGKATSGVVLLWSGIPLLTLSKTQGVVTLSTCEKELMAMVLAVKEGRFMQQVLAPMLKEGAEPNLLVHCDASSAISFTKKQGPGRMVHLDNTAMWLQEQVQRHNLRVKHCGTEDNLADIFTKIFKDVRQYQELCWKIGMRSSTWYQEDVAREHDSVSMVGGDPHADQRPIPSSKARARAAAARGETAGTYGVTVQSAQTVYAGGQHHYYHEQASGSRVPAPALHALAPHELPVELRLSPPTVRQCDYIVVLMQRRGWQREEWQAALQKVTTKAEASFVISSLLAGRDPR
jgi:hypothetical protein